MSLLYAENLLRQYNKNTNAINTTADNVNRGGQRFFTESYLNKYDALYNRYKDNKNFNIQMWHQAFKNGDQDTYLAFLEQNQDTELSAQFYDPMYYDYESMMLELYKPFASATELDADTAKVVKDLGLESTITNDQAYIQYQLEQVRAQRNEEITLDLEQWRKDQLGWWGQFGHDIAATLAEFGEGLLTGLAGIVDVIISPFYATAAAIGGENWLDAFVDYFGSKGLTAAEKQSVRAALDEYERTHTHFMDINGNVTGWGKYFAGAANSIGMMVPAIIANYFTGGVASLAWVGPTTFYASIFSGNMYENANNPYTANSPSWLKITNAAVKTGVEAVIEWGLGKVLGGTIQNAAIGMTGGRIGSGIIKGMGRGAGFKYLLKSAGQEGLEEFLQDFSTNLADQFTDLIYEGYGNTGVTFQTLVDSFCIGALSSLVMSGGQIAVGGIGTSIQNKRIEKKTGIKGGADVYIEVDGKPKKVRGATKLYYSSIISDFQCAVDNLSKSKITNEKTLALAQEVYGALDVMSQFYSSFSKERIENAEKLLSRVMIAEQSEIDAFRDKHSYASTILTDETITDIVSQNTKEDRLHAFAATIEKDFRSMVGEVQLRYAGRVRAAAERVASDLEAGGVTAASGVVDIDGARHTMDPELQKLVDKLEGKLDELHDDYDFIVITDGHVAIEEDKMLFVSEAWLKNYETSELYKFLAQTRVLKTIAADKELQPLIKSLITFDKEFTKQENVTAESALMDLLFNKTVYEAFLLSHKGERMHEFKSFIFRLHDIIKLLGEDKIDADKRTTPATKAKKKAYLNTVYEQIKETMRIPTIKAILNWTMNAQLIGADSILTQADREYINAFQTRKRLAAKENKGAVSSAYEHVVEEIIRDGHFTKSEMALIDKGLADNANNNDRLMALALLNTADARMTNYDFEINTGIFNSKSAQHNLAKILHGTMPNVPSSFFTDLRGDITAILRQSNISEDDRAFLREVLDNTTNRFNRVDPNLSIGQLQEIRNEERRTYLTRNAERLTEIFKKAAQFVSTSTSHSFIIPAEAFGDTQEGAASIQYKADKLDEFEKTYGISAQQMITGNLVGMGMEQVKQMQEDMQILGYSDYALFVQYKLEVMLGPDYVIVPEYTITGDNMDNETGEILAEKTARVTGFSILNVIPAQTLLNPMFSEVANKIQFIEDLAENELTKITTANGEEYIGNKIPMQFVTKIKGLDDWTILLVNNDTYVSYDGVTISSEKLICISRSSSDLYNTLVHELNHAVQNTYNLPHGGTTSSVSWFKYYLRYLVKHFMPVLEYKFRRAGFGIVEYERLKKTGDIYTVSRRVLSQIEQLGYELLQGELFAEHFTHNGKPVSSFRIDKDRTTIIGPNGELFGSTKTNEEYAFEEKAKSDMIVPDHYIQNAVAREFDTVYRTRNSLYDNGYMHNSNIRNTYHSTLSKKSGTEVVQSIVNKALPITTRLRTTINDVILAPKTYLDQEILDKLGDDLSEGRVYYFLKDYIEKQYDSVSIDRTAETHEYILVDDNAFDDLLRKDMLKRANDEGSTYIADNLEGVRSLFDFYDTMKLMGLKIGSVQVVIMPNVKSETNGKVITINSMSKGKARTDAEILDTLNHEFRHVMQENSNLETGFTADFVVTAEMLKDLKARVPEIFDNDIRIHAQRAGIKNVDAYIAQRFIYYLVGGEKNAYGIKASMLNAKPIYVTREAGNYTIFMPWYNADTGEGRYVTTLTDKSAEDDGSKGTKLPRVERRPKYKKAIVDDLSKEDKLVKYIYEGRRREVLVRDSKNNNLKYFRKTGERTQLDVDLYDFIVATTGHEDKLPPAIVNAIKKGVLTKQSLYKWFRQVDPSKINQYTFDLINKYMFKNKYINDMSELDRITMIDPSFYWAASIVLRQNNLKLDTLAKENSIDTFLSFLSSLEGTKWKEEIEKLQTKFDWYKTDKGIENYILDEKISNYMRVFTMQWFDGTLAGAFYMANAFRKTVKAYEAELSGNLSLDAERQSGKGDKKTTLGDTISNEDAAMDTNDRRIANDIEALYDITTNVPTEDMISELIRLKYLDEVDTLVSGLTVSDEAKKKISTWLKERDALVKNFKRLSNKENRTDAENKLLKQLNYVISKLQTIMQKMSTYQQTLDDMHPDEISARYAEIVNAEMVDSTIPASVIDTKNTGYKNTRVNIVSRIKRTSTMLLNLIRDGKIAFSQLPQEVQDMFELKTYEVEGKKKIQQYELKPEVYSVGRGPATLPGQSTGRMLYSGKRNMADTSQTQQHAVDTILKNDETLRLTLSVVRQEIKKRQSGIDKGVKQVKTLQKKLDKQIKDGLARAKAAKEKHETPFRVSTKRHTSDTPNNFTVTSDIAMPDVLRGVLDTSFEDMANTEVQFASRDKDGNLLDRETLGDRKFESRLKHEINNWDAFYEANRTHLLGLTRQDVLDIVEFFQVANMTSVDGPINKLTAFEIFILGYLVDASRRNFNNWDFSDSEKEMIEQLYEKKASAYGSGLNAVSQMLSVIDPFKRVRQRMLDDYNITEAELEPLFKAVDAVQQADTLDARRQRTEDLAKELDRIETLMAAGDIREKGFGKRWYQKLKSARYSFMLSSPITWIRNIVSNVVVQNFNKASDVIGNMFVRKGYRENQWELSKVQVSPEVKTFIDENIKNSELFDALYESTSKYDNGDKKNIDMQKDLFVNMIVRALEQKYAAQHRFDNATANALAKFVSKMISDKRFIKHATEKYLGKILTIEIGKGNVDLEHGLSNRVLNLFAEAVILSNNDYMHKRSFLADAIAKIRDTSPAAYEVLTFWQPFLNSSFNWFNELLKYSPVGMVTSIINMARLEKTINKIEERRAKGEVLPDSRAVEYLARRDVGKGVIGMVLTTLGILLGLFGIIRLDDEDDKMYIYVGDVKIDITNIFGTSSILVGASLAQWWVQEDVSVDEIMRMATTQLFEGFILNDLLARHQWDEGIWDFFLTEGESVLRSFVPQMVQILIRATNNEKIKYTSGFVGMWERWLNTFVPTQPFGSRKINPYTGEVQTKYALPFFGEFFKSGLLGPKIFWSEVSDEELLAKEYGINKGELTGELTANGKKYSLDKEALNVKYGQLNKATLAQLKQQKHYFEMPNGTYKTLSWDKMSDEQRANVISREMTKNADYAKIYVWTQVMGNKYYASESLWQLLRKLGITKNVYRGDKGFVE